MVPNPLGRSHCLQMGSSPCCRSITAKKIEERDSVSHPRSLAEVKQPLQEILKVLPLVRAPPLWSDVHLHSRLWPGPSCLKPLKSLKPLGAAVAAPTLKPSQAHSTHAAHPGAMDRKMAAGASNRLDGGLIHIHRETFDRLQDRSRLQDRRTLRERL